MELDLHLLREVSELHPIVSRLAEGDLPPIDGDWLQERGVEPGPIYRQILGALRDARLDGQVGSLSEEEALAERLLALRQE